MVAMFEHVPTALPPAPVNSHGTCKPPIIRKDKSPRRSRRNEQPRTSFGKVTSNHQPTEKKILCTSSTEWLLQKTLATTRGECCRHGGPKTVVLRTKRCKTHGPHQTSRLHKLILTLFQRPTYLQKLHKEMVGQERRAKDTTKK